MGEDSRNWSEEVETGRQAGISNTACALIWPTQQAMGAGSHQDPLRSCTECTSGPNGLTASTMRGRRRMLCKPREEGFNNKRRNQGRLAEQKQSVQPAAQNPLVSTEFPSE